MFNQGCVKSQSLKMTAVHSFQLSHIQTSVTFFRDQARGRFGRNSRPRGRNFALNGTQGEVGVSLKKKKKKKKKKNFFFFFFFFFFLGRLIFILSPQKCKLW